MRILAILSVLVFSTAISSAQCSLNQVQVRVEIDTDPWGSEISWQLTDIMGNVFLQGGQGGVYASNSYYTDSVCVAADGCFFFEIYDTFGDGIYAPDGYRLYVDDVLIASGANNIGSYANVTAHCPNPCGMTADALNDLQAHINGIQSLTVAELTYITTVFYEFPECLAESETMILLGKNVVADFDTQIGTLFTTPNTLNGIYRDAVAAPGLDVERAMLALQQGIFDAVFTPSIYAAYPQHINGWMFNSCYSFPGHVDTPVDSTLTIATTIRANFADPDGMNPYFGINADGTEHALRPTGLYLAPGSVARITVPQSLVGQDYYIRVGSHEWDLTNRPTLSRLDRISKKFPIDSTTVAVFNPLGGAISILVPFGAAEGLVQVSVTNGVECPFYSLKSFYQTPDFSTELSKPGPWAVFETDNVMFTVPSHSIIPGQNDLQQSLLDWDAALQGVNSIMARQIVSDKHNMYMIADLDIRVGVYSIGYPMSNNNLTYTNVPGSAYFMNGPGPDDAVNFHESGHAAAISKFPGEEEALVNFLYVMGMNHGLNVDLNVAVNYSFVPNSFDIDRTATHRMVSNTFGSARNISNTTMDEVRYQHRGYGHYSEIVNMFGWCPLRNFWKKEFIDFENGIGIGGNDLRIVRMSQAAQADLRPLFHVFGILPQDSLAVQDTLAQLGTGPSHTVYNRLQAYFNLLPADSSEFVSYALSVYPTLYSEGPTADPDFGVGWHYLKSLTYNTTQAQQRSALLQAIIDLYFPDGEPMDNGPMDVCCTLDTMSINVVNDALVVTGGVEPYALNVDTLGGVQTVTVTDFDNCVATAQYIITDLNPTSGNEIKVFPNPTAGEVKIDVGTYQGTVTIAAIDAQGRAVHSTSGSVTRVVTYNLPEAQGVYLLRITYSDQTSTHLRVVKM